MTDLAFALAGFAVGTVVGLTGVGGACLGPARAGLKLIAH